MKEKTLINLRKFSIFRLCIFIFLVSNFYQSNSQGAVSEEKIQETKTLKVVVNLIKENVNW